MSVRHVAVSVEWRGAPGPYVWLLFTVCMLVPVSLSRTIRCDDYAGDERTWGQSALSLIHIARSRRASDLISGRIQRARRLRRRSFIGGGGRRRKLALWSDRAREGGGSETREKWERREEERGGAMDVRTRGVSWLVLSAPSLPPNQLQLVSVEFWIITNMGLRHSNVNNEFFRLTLQSIAYLVGSAQIT